MTYSLLLISYIENELLPLRAQLQRTDKSLVVETAINLRQGVTKLAAKPHQLTILNVDSISDGLIKQVRNFRAVVDNCSMMVLGQLPNKEHLKALSSIPRTVVLEKPFLEKDLHGITHKMLTAGEAAQRIHRRFQTNQKAFFEVYGKNIEGEIRVSNLSKGGAYCELPGRTGIESGDLVKLNIQLDETQNHHRMHGKVIWTSKYEQANGRYGLGVEFIQRRDVLSHWKA